VTARLVARLAVVAALGLGLVLGPAVATAQASTSVTLKTTIDGRSVSGSSASHPVTLSPNRPAQVDIQVTNVGSSHVTLSSVNVTGVVAGLTFFSYQTSIALSLAPGDSTHLRYALSLTDLSGQATGLIPARISVSDSHGHVVASQSFVSDVRGSLDSVYGLFGLALLLLTIAAIAGATWSIATHRMPRNRWRRALRLLTVGLGLGLVLVFTLSALRVWVPSPGRWLVTVLVFAVVFFVIGYLTPTPSSPEDEEEVDESEFLAEPIPTASAPAESSAAEPVTEPPPAPVTRADPVPESPSAESSSPEPEPVQGDGTP
jgi:hypothetical protein